MKSKSLLLIFLSFFTFFYGLAQTNETEPNNTAAAANTIAVSAAGNGHISTPTDVDWWKITLGTDGKLDVTVTDKSDDYTNFYLYDNNGMIVLNSGTVGSHTSNTYSIDGLAAGTYYIAFTAYNTSVDTSTYSFTTTLTAPPVANDAEPDSTKAQALTLPLNGKVTGHVGYYYNNHRDSSDWYKVTTNADGLLRLRIITEPSSLNAYVNFTLYDNDGATVLGSNTVGANTTADFNYDGLAAGTYYVKMFPYNINVDYVSYVLADSLFAAPVANDIEPNNSKATADSLPLNTTITGHVGYLYNNLRDTSDWYKVIANTDGMLQLTITTEPSSLNAYINYALYDADGTTVITSNTIGAATTNVYNIDGLGKGIYYLKMYQYSPNDYVSYKVKDSLYTYQYAADSSYEPNAYASQAKTILSNRTVTGHFGFYMNGGRTTDNTDWFKLNYTGASDLSFVLNHLPHLSDGGNDYVNFYMYKDTSAAPVYSTTFGSETTDNITLNNLTQGYYYIKISQYSNNDFEAYSLSNSFTQVNIAAISIKSTTSLNACSSNSISYNLSKSHSPYTVKLYRNGTAYDSTMAAADTARFNNLPDGNYYATVYGDGATDSAYSKSATAQFLPPYSTGLTTTNIGVHTATLNWTPTGCAKYYRIQYRAQGSSAWTTIDNPANTGGAYTLSGLTMYTNYSWHIAAVDSAQGQQLVSVYSDSAVFLTLSDTAHIMLTHAGMGASCNSDTLQYQLSNSVAPYTVQLYRDGAIYGAALMANATATFTGLPSGVYYATATGTGSGGSFGTSTSDTLLPPVPTGMYTDSIKSMSAMLNWNAVSCVSYFDVQYKQKDSANWITVMTMGNMNSYNAPGLMPNAMYVWRVASVDTSNKQMIISAYSATDSFTTISALPVTLISFNGKIVSNTIQLSWQTLTETNNKYFEAERSADGINFTAIGTINAHSNSGISQAYTLTDNLPLQGDNYYRLKQVDNNGQAAYSGIVKIYFSSLKALFTVYPNPAKDVITIKTSVAVTSPVVMIYDMKGSIVMQQQLHGNFVSQQLNISRLAAGTYTVVLFDGTHSENTRFIKE